MPSNRIRANLLGGLLAYDISGKLAAFAALSRSARVAGTAYAADWTRSPRRRSKGRSALTRFATPAGTNCVATATLVARRREIRVPTSTRPRPRSALRGRAVALGNRATGGSASCSTAARSACRRRPRGQLRPQAKDRAGRRSKRRRPAGRRGLARRYAADGGRVLSALGMIEKPGTPFSTWAPWYMPCD